MSSRSRAADDFVVIRQRLIEMQDDARWAAIYKELYEKLDAIDPRPWSPGLIDRTILPLAVLERCLVAQALQCTIDTGHCGWDKGKQCLIARKCERRRILNQ